MVILNLAYACHSNIPFTDRSVINEWRDWLWILQQGFFSAHFFFGTLVFILIIGIMYLIYKYIIQKGKKKK